MTEFYPSMWAVNQRILGALMKYEWFRRLNEEAKRLHYAFVLAYLAEYGELPPMGNRFKFVWFFEEDGSLTIRYFNRRQQWTLPRPFGSDTTK
jgi:hypothetical protein